ncbi:AraC family transcriptional regulator [Roseburia hominis]
MEEGYVGKMKFQEEFHENKKHGSLLFPFNIYPCTIPGDFPSVPLHWHKDLELIYVKKGKGYVQMDREVFFAASGDIFVCPPGCLHAIRGDEGASMEYENIICEVEFLGGGAADVCAREYLVPLEAGQLLLPMHLEEKQEEYAKVQECLSYLEHLCKERPKGYELGVKSVMLALLFLFLKVNPGSPRKDSLDTVRLKETLQFIETHYKKQISVAEIAEYCGLSNSHFMRWFKEMTGSSFVSYVNERRLAAAASLLRQTEDKILSIAGETGFSNLSHFNRQFRARYKVTPKQYRQIRV